MATMVTRSGGAFTPRASVRRSVNADSTRSRNRKWPLLWPSHIAPAQSAVQSNATRISRRRRLIRLTLSSESLLSQSCHQGRYARRWPAFHDQFARRLDIDPLARTEHDAAAATRTRDVHAAVDDEDGGLGA